jgi:hypothetical protein
MWTVEFPHHPDARSCAAAGMLNAQKELEDGQQIENADRNKKGNLETKNAFRSWKSPPSTVSIITRRP